MNTVVATAVLQLPHLNNLTPRAVNAFFMYGCEVSLFLVREIHAQRASFKEAYCSVLLSIFVTLVYELKIKKGISISEGRGLKYE